MKRLFVLLMFCLFFCLTACGSQGFAPFDYSLEEQVFVDSDSAEDGTLAAEYRYSVPKMVAKEKLSKVQRASVDAFNAEMEALVRNSLDYYASLKETALADYEYFKATGIPWDHYYADALDYVEYRIGASAISLFFDEYTDTGGAHPTSGVLCKLYDIEGAAWLTAEELTDDLAAFKAVIAENILHDIEATERSEQYYDDYRTTVEALDGVEYYFTDGGVFIYFQDYTLGPHAVGIQEFYIPAEIFSPALNERAHRVLGY